MTNINTFFRRNKIKRNNFISFYFENNLITPLNPPFIGLYKIKHNKFACFSKYPHSIRKRAFHSVATDCQRPSPKNSLHQCVFTFQQKLLYSRPKFTPRILPEVAAVRLARPLAEHSAERENGSSRTTLRPFPLLRGAEVGFVRRLPPQKRRSHYLYNVSGA